MTEALRGPVPARVPQPGRRDHRLPRADRRAPRQIVDLLLAGLERRLAEQDLTLELTPAARALIVREGTDPAFGARPLKRTIQRLVENPLARALVAGEFKPGDRITADADLGRRDARVLDRSGDRRHRRAAATRRPRGRPETEAAAAGAGAASRRSRSSTCRRRDGPSATTASWSTEPMRFERGGRGRLTDPAARPSRCRPRPAALMPVFPTAGSRDRRPVPPIGPRRPAGVLVLLFPDADGDARVVLTERVTATAITAARSASRAARPSRMMPTSRRPRCARRPRRSALDPAAAGRPRRRRARAVLDPGQRLRGHAGRRARRAAARPGRLTRPRSPGSSSRRSRVPAGRADRDRRADDPRLAAPLRRLRGRRPVGLGRDRADPEPARGALLGDA